MSCFFKRRTLLLFIQTELKSKEIHRRSNESNSACCVVFFFFSEYRAFSLPAERVNLKLAANATVSVRRAENRKIKGVQNHVFCLVIDCLKSGGGGFTWSGLWNWNRHSGGGTGGSGCVCVCVCVWGGGGASVWSASLGNLRKKKGKKKRLTHF